jgi:succinoglycan biosynthesis protein ExoV
MKLFYYRGNNFGDKLNPMIWEGLIPELLDDDDSTLLVGIGTLINSNAPATPQKVVFGAGAGYMSPARIDDKWKFYCVRGPLTAETLGLEKSLAVTDPALLLTQVVTGPAVATGQVCFMPHHTSAEYADWGAICAKAGITYLDPAADMHELIAAIRGARLVIAEAMHGAIVADAFRVPWVPVQCYSHILGFKWDDWCQSMAMPYRPETIPSVWDIDRTLTPRNRLAAKVKRGLRQAGIWTDNWTPPFPATNIRKVEDSVIAALSQLATGERACLSNENLQQAALGRLIAQIEQMKRDYVRVEC